MSRPDAGPATTVEVRLLGPVEAYRDGEPVPLGGRKQRTVLAALAADVDRPLSADRLIDIVWGESATDTARRSLQVYVSNLRGLIDPDRHGLIEGTGDGYRLAGPPAISVDWRRFESLAAAEDRQSLRAALDLWRGPPFGGIDGDRLQSVAVAWTEDYLSTVERWAAACATDGDPAAPVADLERLVEAHPLRESLWHTLMSCLAGAGRHAEALATYRRVQDHLGQAGLSPSPPLRELEDRILLDDPGLVTQTDRPARLPSGIVTFLFADIESSTRLLHRLGDRYPKVLDRYRSLIASAAEPRGGTVVSFDGDGAFIAFESPAGAVDAAIDLQRRLADERWPRDVEVRARSGIHSGLASPRDGDYVALAVHQASRVVGAANGGQILVSEATATFLADRADLQPLGRFRLRDFDAPITLYLASVPGVEQGHDIRAVPAGRHNLVRPLTPTVGREEALAELTSMITGHSLTTLVGPGGVGKTRLAGDVGLGLADRFADGVWKVSLATVEDDGQLGTVLADAIGAPAAGDNDLAIAVEYLTTRQAVVYLDNCEHLLEACREVVGEIIASCPQVAILATSREPLGLPGERVHRVAPLELPPGTGNAEAVRNSAAGQLLEARGAAADRTFRIDDTTARAAAELCTMVDGLPLLIELAAAQLAFRNIDEVVAGVGTSLDSLRARGGAWETRHRTADAVLEWSYGLLDSRQREACRRLALFGSSFSIDMARVVIPASNEGDPTPSLVWDLLDRSLLVDDRSANETRYRMLRTVRLFARAKAAAEGDTGPAARLLADHFLDVVGPWHPIDGRWVSTVGQEADNLRALIGPLAEEDPERAQQLACVLARHHNAAQSFADGIEEAARLVAQLPTATPSLVALQAAEADLRLRTGDLEGAAACIERARRLEADVGQPPWDDVAVDRAEGELARRSGDPGRAVEIARARLSDEISDRGRSRMYNILGMAAAGQGHLGTALDAFNEELAAIEAAGAEPWIPSAHGNIAEIAYRLGEIGEAAEHQSIALQRGLEEGLPAYVAFSFMLAARLAGEDEDWETALRLQLEADQMLEEIGLALFAEDASSAEAVRALARAALGAERYRAIASEAAATDVAEATELAQRILTATANA